MNTKNKLKIFNDPIYGFISIPNSLIFDLIAHPYFQRLRRISQMGLSYLVYPGAHHTRFHHALGCLHLMQKAVGILKCKGVHISEEEETALYCAILLHDIGHGPFSHAMEHSIVKNTSHEDLSLLFMQALNEEFNGKLSVAIEIFKGNYKRKFFKQLVSGQLDIDRLDYLKRDSFYTGVAEGNINSERLISMFNVFEDSLVIEEKGLYSLEKFITARRLMYWQVYLHKTSLGAEQMMIKILKRAKFLAEKEDAITCSTPLLHFLKNEITIKSTSIEDVKSFLFLDDYDLISAVKNWQFHPDFILRSLSKMLIDRDLLKTRFSKKPFNNTFLEDLRKKLKGIYNISDADLDYFVFTGNVQNLAFDKKSYDLKILLKTNKLSSITKSSNFLKSKSLTKPMVKHYICFPKDIL